jgi:hypothetical protein
MAQVANPNEGNDANQPAYNANGRTPLRERIVTMSNDELRDVFDNVFDANEKNIFWFYYLFLFTDGVLGANPVQSGSIHHYRSSRHFHEYPGHTHN